MAKWSSLPEKLFSLDGHVALVTGAGSGLGKYMAHALLHAGANVILVGRGLQRLQVAAMEMFDSLKQDKPMGHDSYVEDFDQNKWDAVAPELSKRLACIAWDVSKLETLPELAAKAKEVFGAPDILINAAGLNPRKPWEEVTPEIYEYTLRLNLSAPFFLAQALVPDMKAQGWGHIINFGSLQSFRAFPNGLPYGASKGGVAQLTRAMAEAWSTPGTGITANAVAPGFFKTQLTAPLFSKPEVIRALEKQTTMRRLGGCDDVQGLAIFLASHASDYITGQVIGVDGGWLAI
ncbi:MAG: SDR family oxidoreductase [Mailhella sp.]|nr:SDR family oxidoreductase [Mailhella sp.]